MYPAVGPTYDAMKVTRERGLPAERVFLKVHSRHQANEQESMKSSDGLHFVRESIYFGDMTKLLEKALEAVRRLPPDSQDEIALAMLRLSGGEGEAEGIDAAHLPAVLEGLAQAKRREFATDAEIEAAFRRFDK